VTGRHLFSLLLLLVLSKAVGARFGPGAEWLVIGAIAVAGLMASARTSRLLDRLAAVIRHQPNPEQTLVNLENFPLRTDLAERAGVEAPRVPLRGPAEHFSYPPSAATVMKLLATFSCGVLVFVCGLMIVDPSQRGGKWYDLLAGLLVFGGGGAYFVYLGWFAPSTYEITDRHIALLGPRGVHRLIRWEDVTACSHTTNGLRIAAGRTVIRASYILPDYGRFLNLVQSRVQRR
jgi:hypothetical protein